MENRWANYEIPPEKIYKLGPLECVSSSFINALILMEKDYKYFLMNYWNVEYFKKLLMGSRNINMCFVDFLYGMTIRVEKGTVKDINDLLRLNNMAIVQCKASDLTYFPKRLLTHESRGLGHTFLVYGHDPKTHLYRVIDAMANFTGIIPPEQLDRLTDQDGKLSYFPLINNNDFMIPDPEEVFIKATYYNHSIFTQKLFNCGCKSFSLFYKDILDSINWNKLERDQWIDQNTLTISSLNNNRSIIWDSFKNVKVLNADEEQSIGEKIASLKKQWKSLVFLLLKFKQDPKENNVRNIEAKLKLIRSSEEDLLNEMVAIGSRIKSKKAV